MITPPTTDEATAPSQAPASPRLWLTTAEVCEQLQLGAKVIYRAIKRKKLRAAAIDGRGDYRFKQEWIDAWVESCTTPIEIGGGDRR